MTGTAWATVFFQGVQPECQILVDGTNGNVTAAAKKLGISRRMLHRKINEMNAAKAEETDKLYPESLAPVLVRAAAVVSEFAARAQC